MRAVLLAVVLFASSVMSAAAQTLPPPSDGCEVVVQFFNGGLPGTPGVSPDGRFGVRLTSRAPRTPCCLRTATGSSASTSLDAQVPFSVVPLYMDYGYTQQSFDQDGVGPGDQQASCGFIPIQVPAGT